jgi:hypothetical protein
MDVPLMHLDTLIGISTATLFVCPDPDGVFRPEDHWSLRLSIDSPIDQFQSGPSTSFSSNLQVVQHSI